MRQVGTDALELQVSRVALVPAAVQGFLWLWLCCAGSWCGSQQLQLETDLCFASSLTCRSIWGTQVVYEMSGGGQLCW